MTSSRLNLLTLLVLATLVSIQTGTAVDAPSFSKVIGPMLENHCASCHGPKRQKNDLRLDSAEAIQKGGKNGPVFVAGNPDKSPIYHRTTLPNGDGDRMPARGEMLTKAETDALKAWITAGAKFDK